MKKRQRVLLYGNTLVLAGIRLSLEAIPAFEVITLKAKHGAEKNLPAGPDMPTEQELLALLPDVVIFDISSVHLPFLYKLNLQQSGLQLIGINPDRDQILVWSGQQFSELSVKDLISIMHLENRCHGKQLIVNGLPFTDPC